MTKLKAFDMLEAVMTVNLDNLGKWVGLGIMLWFFGLTFINLIGSWGNER